MTFAAPFTEINNGYLASWAGEAQGGDCVHLGFSANVVVCFTVV